jgi:hypothetical protein
MTSITYCTTSITVTTYSTGKPSQLQYVKVISQLYIGLEKRDVKNRYVVDVTVSFGGITTKLSS